MRTYNYFVSFQFKLNDEKWGLGQSEISATKKINKYSDIQMIAEKLMLEGNYKNVIILNYIKL